MSIFKPEAGHYTEKGRIFRTIYTMAFDDEESHTTLHCKLVKHSENVGCIKTFPVTFDLNVRDPSCLHATLIRDKQRPITKYSCRKFSCLKGTSSEQSYLSS